MSGKKRLKLPEFGYSVSVLHFVLLSIAFYLLAFILVLLAIYITAHLILGPAYLMDLGDVIIYLNVRSGSALMYFFILLALVSFALSQLLLSSIVKIPSRISAKKLRKIISAHPAPLEESSYAIKLDKLFSTTQALAESGNESDFAEIISSADIPAEVRAVLEKIIHEIYKRLDGKVSKKIAKALMTNLIKKTIKAIKKAGLSGDDFDYDKLIKLILAEVRRVLSLYITPILARLILNQLEKLFSKILTAADTPESETDSGSIISMPADAEELSDSAGVQEQVEQDEQEVQEISFITRSRLRFLSISESKKQSINYSIFITGLIMLFLRLFLLGDDYASHAFLSISSLVAIFIVFSFVTKTKAEWLSAPVSAVIPAGIYYFVVELQTKNILSLQSHLPILVLFILMLIFVDGFKSPRYQSVTISTIGWLLYLLIINIVYPAYYYGEFPYIFENLVSIILFSGAISSGALFLWQRYLRQKIIALLIKSRE